MNDRKFSKVSIAADLVEKSMTVKIAVLIYTK